MAKLRADRSLIRNFVEETLRFETPVLGLFRQATQDVELSGTVIPAGTIVFMAYGSANRDEEKFDDGESFDVSRKNAGRTRSGADTRRRGISTISRREIGVRRTAGIAI